MKKILVAVVGVLFPIMGFAAVQTYQSPYGETLKFNTTKHTVEINNVCEGANNQNIGVANYNGKYKTVGGKVEIYGPTQIMDFINGNMHMSKGTLHIFFSKTAKGDLVESKPYPLGSYLTGWHGASCQFGFSSPGKNPPVYSLKR